MAKYQYCKFTKDKKIKSFCIIFFSFFTARLFGIYLWLDAFGFPILKTETTYIQQGMSDSRALWVIQQLFAFNFFCVFMSQ